MKKYTNNEHQTLICCPILNHAKPVAKLENYAKTNKKFSGFIAYDRTFKLEKTADKAVLVIEDAGEDVEVFVNGASLGICGDVYLLH